MEKIAILMTCYNRRDKTLACLASLSESYVQSHSSLDVTVFLTDDGCTDGTKEAIISLSSNYRFPIHILAGNGKLFWNGGMIMAWRTAIKTDDFDGFLWLNDDVIIRPEFWTDLLQAEAYAINCYGKEGIYVGSTCSSQTHEFTYGGFDFGSKWTLNDCFVIPNGKDFQPCQCAQGNITFISKAVKEKMGILYDRYVHGTSDYDYTYRAYKMGFPLLVMPHYAGICENDHKIMTSADYYNKPLAERIKGINSPFGLNLRNSLLFQKRCFPYRYPFIALAAYFKMLFPTAYFGLYKFLRKLNI